MTVKKSLRTFLAASICLLAATPVAHAQYSGGSGTADDPYQIATAADLIALGETPDDYDKHFILTADIDLDPNLPGRKIFDRAVIAPDMDDKTTIHFEGERFTGVLDGVGHTISNLAVDGVAFLGLIGLLGEGGLISDLGVADITVTGSGYYAGGLIGRSDGTVTRCFTTGAVTGTANTGGLLGRNRIGSISDCYCSCVTVGTLYVGGLVGFNDHSIARCYATGRVSGDKNVGGLIGYGSGRHVTDCFWDIQTSEQTTSVGGTGLTTTEMQIVSTFLNWIPCDGEWMWTIHEGIDYPRLRWEDQPGKGIGSARPHDSLAGSGTEDDPYLIYNAEQLNGIALYPCDLDKHFKLMADIDLSEYSYNRAVIAPDLNDDEDGFQGAYFTGVFDGNDHTISNLVIMGENFLGLFGIIGYGAIVLNLGLEAVEVNGTNRVGGLVGTNWYGHITTCYSTGMVRGTGWAIGGLVGDNSGRITACYNTGTVGGSDLVGGLVGTNWDKIQMSYSTGTVTGDYAVGGLAGENFGSGDFGTYASITTSSSSCTVSGTANYIGGLVGSNSSNITASYSIGSVSGPDQTVGGLVGRRPFSRSGMSRTGITVTSFWDIQTSGQATSGGGTGLTTTEMQDMNTYLNAGWDFVDEIRNGTCDHWQMSPGDYPRLRSPVMPEGLGTAEQPYLIRDALDLGTLWFQPMACYRLEASIDLSGVTWSAPVVPRFDGTFDGNGYVISNLHIQGSKLVGLFGLLVSYG